jgi:hypothetical protein
MLLVKGWAVFVSGPGEEEERPEKWGEHLEEFRDGTSASLPRRGQHLEMLREL